MCVNDSCQTHGTYKTKQPAKCVLLFVFCVDVPRLQIDDSDGKIIDHGFSYVLNVTYEKHMLLSLNIMVTFS